MGVRVSPCTRQRGHGGWAEGEDGAAARMPAGNAGYQLNCSCPGLVPRPQAVLPRLLSLTFLWELIRA